MSENYKIRKIVKEIENDIDGSTLKTETKLQSKNKNELTWKWVKVNKKKCNIFLEQKGYINITVDDDTTVWISVKYAKANLYTDFIDIGIALEWEYDLYDAVGDYEKITGKKLYSLLNN